MPSIGACRMRWVLDGPGFSRPCSFGVGCCSGGEDRVRVSGRAQWKSGRVGAGTGMPQCPSGGGWGDRRRFCGGSGRDWARGEGSSSGSSNDGGATRWFVKSSLVSWRSAKPDAAGGFRLIKMATSLGYSGLSRGGLARAMREGRASWAGGPPVEANRSRGRRASEPGGRREKVLVVRADRQSSVARIGNELRGRGVIVLERKGVAERGRTIDFAPDSSTVVCGQSSHTHNYSATHPPPGCSPLTHSLTPSPPTSSALPQLLAPICSAHSAFTTL
jgi:hypothetical protein